MWTSFIELIRATIFAAAHVCGGSLGGGVVAVSTLVRLALLPLTLRMAREALARQRATLALRPELERLQKRFAKDPSRLLTETKALHGRHGIQLLDPRPLLGGLVQMPLLIGLYSAVRSGLGAGVRYLWIADLARPDRLLVVAVAGLSVVAMTAAPQPTPTQSVPTAALVLAGAFTFVALWTASSTIALSWGAGSLVSTLQGWLLRRELAHQAARAG